MLVEVLSEGVAQGSPTVQVADIRRGLHETEDAGLLLGPWANLKGCTYMAGRAHWVCTTKALASQMLKRMIPFRSME